MDTIFIYGTLRRGEANDIVEAARRHGIALPERLGRATVQGTLYDFGGYPGLVLQETGGAVLGEVYRIAAALVPVLDEIEEVFPGQQGLFAHQHTRVAMLAQAGDDAASPEPASDAAVCDCLFYPVAPTAVIGRPVIPGGDWIAYRRERDLRSA